MPVDKYGVNWDGVSDIAYRFDESDEDKPGEAADPIVRHLRTKAGEKSRAGSRRRIWPGLSPRRKPKPEEKSTPEEKEKRERRAAIARAYWLRAAAQIAPWAAILLLAPFISGPGGFYLLVLLLGAPVTAAAILLRPLGRQIWILRALAPLLPVEAWFALRYFSWDPRTALALVILFVLGGPLYFALRNKVPGKGGPNSEARHARLERETKRHRQARRTRGKDDTAADKGRKRRFLLFVVPLMCAALLAPALLGLGLQLYRPSPNVIEENSLEAQSLMDDVLMARRMNGAYEHLQPEAWQQAGRQDKLKALQALLDVETDRMGIRRFDLRDPTVLAAAGGDAHTAVPALLQSGGAKADLRVRAICHLAFHLKQLIISEGVNLQRFEEEAGIYENTSYNAYLYVWENREAEIDHAG